METLIPIGLSIFLGDTLRKPNNLLDILITIKILVCMQGSTIENKDPFIGIEYTNIGIVYLLSNPNLSTPYL